MTGHLLVSSPLTSHQHIMCMCIISVLYYPQSSPWCTPPPPPCCPFQGSAQPCALQSGLQSLQSPLTAHTRSLGSASCKEQIWGNIKYYFYLHEECFFQHRSLVSKMDSLPEIIISHIGGSLKYMTFNTESINDYVSAIGSHISHLSDGLSLPTIPQYLSWLSSVQLADQVDSFCILLAGMTLWQKYTQ